MKKTILTTAMALCLTAAFAQQQGDNKQNGNKQEKKTEKVSQQSLPENSQTTINDYFPSNTVKSVTKNNKDNDKNYEVKFKEGSSVSFDDKGDWKKVSTNSKTSVPNDMVPSKINDVISKKYSNQKIKSIEKHDDGGYSVTLASGAVLLFSSVLALISASN